MSVLKTVFVATTTDVVGIKLLRTVETTFVTVTSLSMVNVLGTVMFETTVLVLVKVIISVERSYCKEFIVVMALFLGLSTRALTFRTIQ